MKWIVSVKTDRQIKYMMLQVRILTPAAIPCSKLLFIYLYRPTIFMLPKQEKGQKISIYNENK